MANDQQFEYTHYSTRMLRKDLHMRMKSLAPFYQMTMQEFLNVVLEKGLDVLEEAKDVYEKKQKELAKHGMF